MLKVLTETPIVSMACNKVGISRQTFYRWTSEDREYRRLTNEAKRLGEALLNDVAESAMMKKIQEGHWQAIKYRLDKKYLKYQLAHGETGDPRLRYSEVSDDLYAILDELEQDVVDNSA